MFELEWDRFHSLYRKEVSNHDLSFGTHTAKDFVLLMQVQVSSHNYGHM